MLLSAACRAPSVSAHADDIADVFDLGDDYKGVALIGPPVNTTGGLAVGDTLIVPTKEGGRASCECVEFPLVNLGPERIDWVRMSFVGISTAESSARPSGDSAIVKRALAPRSAPPPMTAQFRWRATSPHSTRWQPAQPAP